MQYLNKFLSEVKKNPVLFKSSEIILMLGISSSQIKNLKKFALENQLITQTKQGFYLTSKAEEYLEKNPIQKWATKEFSSRPEINLEYFKEEKTNSVLTKAIRGFAKHLLENQELKKFSLEQLIVEDIKSCKTIIKSIENDILNGKKIALEKIYEKYIQQGLTKSLLSVILLVVITNNLDKIAIYEKSQFQLKFDALMFDRIIACPQNFEIQLTEMQDEYILKDVSKVILNNKSNNILEITKGLISFFKTFDKYTIHTEHLSSKTIRFRNIVLNAKDPISLFERDIPKAFGYKNLQECDRKFLDDLKKSLNELKDCPANLVKELRDFIFESFHTESKENLYERFFLVKEYIGEKELKVLFNSVVEINVDEDLWVKRIATFINKSRVPKDWSDEDYADFKVKTKELAFKFSILETTIGTNDCITSKNYHSILKKYLDLSLPEKFLFLRQVVNLQNAT